MSSEKEKEIRRHTAIQLRQAFAEWYSKHENLFDSDIKMQELLRLAFYAGALHASEELGKFIGDVGI